MDKSRLDACKRYRDKNKMLISSKRAFLRVTNPITYGKNLEAQRKRRVGKPPEKDKEVWKIMTAVNRGHIPRNKKKLKRQIDVLKQELGKLTLKLNLRRKNKMDNNDLEVAFNIKDKFAIKRHDEHVFLSTLRNKLSMDIIMKRDEIATKRHGERITILKGEF